MAFSIWLQQPCLLCLTPSFNPLCSACDAFCLRIDCPCAQCGLPLASAERICGECLQNPKPYDTAVCPFLYCEPLSRLVHLFKERLPEVLLDFFTHNLTEQLRPRYKPEQWPDYLIPVPSHWLRQIRRGYNPAACIAERTGKQLNLPLLQALAVARLPRAQKSLNKADRQKNLTDTFTLKPVARRALRGAHVALIDDVITTGTTAALLSAMLNSAGARRVDVWALARTPLPSIL